MALFLKKYLINFIFLFLAFALFQKVIWIKDFFGMRTNYIEILYNFTVNYNGVKDIPFHFKILFIRNILIYPLLAAILWMFLLEKAKTNTIIKNFFEKIKDLKFINIITKISLKLLLNFKVYFLISLFFYFHKLDFFDFILVNKDLENTKQLYYNPNNIEFNNPVQKKNLILFFTESLEYQIRSLDPKNPIQKIDDIKGNYINNFKHAPATGFSIGAVVSSQCSVPFYPAISMNLTLFKKNELMCLSDVLANYNYEQIFYITVSGDFHLFGNFNKEHSLKVIDKNKIVEDGLPKERLTGWADGVHDDDFLKHASKKIIELHKSKKPFNATIITTDTHFPYLISPRCKEPVKLSKNKKEEYFNKIVRSYRCSSEYISNFFNELEEAGVLDNTVVVITGDHTMADKKEFTISESLDRNIYFKMNNKKPFLRDKINHFDIAPTILDSLGFLPPDNSRFAFGVSALRDDFDYKSHYEKVMDKKIVSDYLIHELFNTSQ